MAATAENSVANGNSTAVEPKNPYLVGLLAATGLSWLLAFMLWLALAQVTDYTTYNIDDAAALVTWIDILILGGVVAAVGATVIAGIRRELRLAHRS
jgi:hypothetical protein